VRNADLDLYVIFAGIVWFHKDFNGSWIWRYLFDILFNIHSLIGTSDFGKTAGFDCLPMRDEL
jgi:hypothetical protein